MKNIAGDRRRSTKTYEINDLEARPVHLDVHRLGWATYIPLDLRTLATMVAQDQAHYKSVVRCEGGSQGFQRGVRNNRTKPYQKMLCGLRTLVIASMSRANS